eukprot:TRINITY_DN17287_c0_g6_i4.p1 TRINITY_DN17287_c0_g6~~TRINITY_DN17287_c0_g6_i4.p1  ORF type:complete len:1073 (+),score=275.35 TRINITY_DN17287_c0_g6_i4:107-3325(+)
MQLASPKIIILSFLLCHTVAGESVKPAEVMGLASPLKVNDSEVGTEGNSTETNKTRILDKEEAIHMNTQVESNSTQVVESNSTQVVERNSTDNTSEATNATKEELKTGIRVTVLEDNRENSSNTSDSNHKEEPKVEVRHIVNPEVSKTTATAATVQDLKGEPKVEEVRHVVNPEVSRETSRKEELTAVHRVTTEEDTDKSKSLKTETTDTARDKKEEPEVRRVVDPEVLDRNEPNANSRAAPEVALGATWAFSPNRGRKGLPIAMRHAAGDSKHVAGTIISRYQGEDEGKTGLWIVKTAEGTHEVASDDLKVRVAEGLEVTDGTHTGVVERVGSGNGTYDGKIMVKFNNVAEAKPVEMGELMYVSKEVVFELDDVVDVRDSEEKEWKVGVVDSLEPLLVKIRGWRNAHSWNQVRHHVKPEPKKESGGGEERSRTVYAVGDKVEVKDGLSGSWRHGTVNSIEGDAVKVLVDGWKSPHTWKFIKVAEEGHASDEGKSQTEKPVYTSTKEVKRQEEKDQATPPPTVPPITMANYTTAWKEVCLHAICDFTADENCVPEYLCTNISGCSWDELDTPPCRKKLKLGDSVGLAPGAHEQGSLRAGEVGVVIQILDEEQPYEVRGGYSDVYRYREDELVPAWNKNTKGIDPTLMNPVLLKWRGSPSFGKAAEELEGAMIDPGLKTPPPEDWGPSGAENGGGTVPTTRKYMPPPVPPPVYTPPPQQPPPVQAIPGPASSDKNPAPVTPIMEAPKQSPVATPTRPPLPPTPPVARPTPAGTIKINPPTARPKKLTAPPATSIPIIHIYAPELPDICGEYTLQPKNKLVRSMSLYISKDCATGECQMFLSHGGFWMVGKHDGDGKANRGVFKSKDKVTSTMGKKTLPFMMKGWEYLSEGVWSDSEGDVDTPDNFAKKGLSPKCSAKMEMNADMEIAMDPETAPPPPPETPSKVPPPPSSPTSSSSAAIEKRADTDGMFYTKEEFRTFYMSDEQWEARASTSTLKSVAEASAGGGGDVSVPFKKDQAVISTQDIILGNTLVVKKGSPGHILGASGTRWQVRFLGVFASAVNVVVESSQIQAAA